MAALETRHRNEDYILVVEDDPLVRRLLLTLLALEGYEAEAVTSGRSALQAVASRLPGLIMLDLVLPDTDGWQVMETLRSQESTAAIPVLVVSSVGNLEHEARRANADDYLAKPFKIESLLEKVGALLTRTSGEDEASLAPTSRAATRG